MVRNYPSMMMRDRMMRDSRGGSSRRSGYRPMGYDSRGRSIPTTPNKSMYETRDYRNDYNNESYNSRDGHLPYPVDDSYYGFYGSTPFGLVRRKDPYDYGDYRRDMRSDYGNDMDYRGMPDYRDYRDYGESEYLSHQELEHWVEKLKRHIDDKDKELYSKEKVLKRAEELSIQFEHFTKEEFYVAVLMMYTDYCKTLGNTNVDIYIHLAKDFLCDEDAAVRFSDKLTAYHDCIANK